MTLTRRELEVARLVCEGLTDQGIAVRLSIAKRTVEWHLEQIRSKLGFDNRAQIAAWVAVRGLAVPEGSPWEQRRPSSQTRIVSLWPCST